MGPLLITGGAGFIGTNFVYYWRRCHPADRLVVLDALTYAGNPANLLALSNDPAMTFVHGDICDEDLLAKLFAEHRFRTVVHFAAESHVDRSIAAPDTFIKTNIQGTHALLKVATASWKDSFDGHRFHHVSTDEVYGSLLPDDPPFTEATPYRPRSPYAASKAGSDFLVAAYANTYGLPITISNCSNNYGPYQFPEKLIPLMIINALEGRPLPLYGDGLNRRDWLYVEDHCAAVDMILHRGRLGETYNVGNDSDVPNLAVIEDLCAALDAKFRADSSLKTRFPNCPAAFGTMCRELLTYVKDRPGHDRRYAIDSEKIAGELGFCPKENFRTGLEKTIGWYLENEAWWRAIQGGEYRNWLSSHYGWRV